MVRITIVLLIRIDHTKHNEKEMFMNVKTTRETEREEAHNIWSAKRALQRPLSYNICIQMTI